MTVERTEELEELEEQLDDALTRRQEWDGIAYDLEKKIEELESNVA